MASTAAAAAPPLAHRTVSSIRTGGTHAQAGQSGPSSPHTPLRSNSSVFGSPSSLRAEEETIIVELGSRRVRVGFAGDAVPKSTITFGPEEQRRVGDFRTWQVGYHNDWRERAIGEDWGSDHELFQLDIRSQDLGLVGDKIERGLREAFAKYLLIDSRPRRLMLVLPPSLPIPLLSTVLDTLFNRFQSPFISLLSAPVASAISAGVRSALIVDLGWAETVITSVYEYREVGCTRSVRGGKTLVSQVHKLLASALGEERTGSADATKKAAQEHLLSFEECEEVASRILWCRPAAKNLHSKPAEGLPTVTETDESELGNPQGLERPESVKVRLSSSSPPAILEFPFEKLSEPCENTFFDIQYSHSSWDDHEFPVHLLIFRHLLQLPMDVRAFCMSRIIFTGGCANILGLRGRIFDEVSQIIHARGWDPVTGRGPEQLKANSKLPRRGSRLATNGATSTSPASDGGSEQDGVWHDAANAVQETDPMEEQLKKGRDNRPKIHGQLRAIDSLGAWSGASLLTQLKVPAISTIDRELWLQQGVAGASRTSDVDVKTLQRQSMGAGGLMRSSAAGTNWTLGPWGNV